MLWLAYLYIAFMVISLPLGVIVLRRLKKDILHPFGGVLSTAISIGFVLSVWFPELVPFHGYSPIVMLVYVIGWDLYTLRVVRAHLPEILSISKEEADSLDNGSFMLGLLTMLPAYACGLYVCSRALEY